MHGRPMASARLMPVMVSAARLKEVMCQFKVDREHPFSQAVQDQLMMTLP
jgi:hypothetical protein